MRSSPGDPPSASQAARVFKRKAARFPEPPCVTLFAKISDGLGEGDSRVGHAAGEAPLVVVPAQPENELAFENLCLVAGEDRRVAVVVEVAGNQRLVGVAEDALELAVGGSLYGLVDLGDRGVA